jgi:hypothetical protein
MHSTSTRVDVSQHPLIRQLIEICTQLELNRDDMVIFGSGSLLTHGLRQNIRDLDVVARGSTWRQAARHGQPAVGTISGAPLAQFCDGRIQFSQQWISADWDTDLLIDRSEILHGLRFAQLADVLAYKYELRRPKDIADIRIWAQSQREHTAASIKCPKVVSRLPRPLIEVCG